MLAKSARVSVCLCGAGLSCKARNSLGAPFRCVGPAAVDDSRLSCGRIHSVAGIRVRLISFYLVSIFVQPTHSMTLWMRVISVVPYSCDSIASSSVARLFGQICVVAHHFSWHQRRFCWCSIADIVWPPSCANWLYRVTDVLGFCLDEATRQTTHTHTHKLSQTAIQQIAIHSRHTRLFEAIRPHFSVAGSNFQFSFALCSSHVQCAHTNTPDTFNSDRFYVICWRPVFCCSPCRSRALWRVRTMRCHQVHGEHGWLRRANRTRYKHMMTFMRL